VKSGIAARRPIVKYPRGEGTYQAMRTRRARPLCSCSVVYGITKKARAGRARALTGGGENLSCFSASESALRSERERAASKHLKHSRPARRGVRAESNGARSYKMCSVPSRGGRVSEGIPAPAPRGVLYPRVYITSASWTQLVILSHRVYAVEVYYDAPRTQPVTDEQRADPAVYDRLPGKRWQGWIAVRFVNDPAVRIVAVTSYTVQCVPQLADLTSSLRGWTISLCRTGGDRFARLVGRWDDRRAPEKNLRAAPDLAGVLAGMWGAPNRPKPLAQAQASATSPANGSAIAREVLNSLLIPV